MVGAQSLRSHHVVETVFEREDLAGVGPMKQVRFIDFRPSHAVDACITAQLKRFTPHPMRPRNWNQQDAAIAVEDAPHTVVRSFPSTYSRKRSIPLEEASSRRRDPLAGFVDRAKCF